MFIWCLCEKSFIDGMSSDIPNSGLPTQPALPQALLDFGTAFGLLRVGSFGMICLVEELNIFNG